MQRTLELNYDKLIIGADLSALCYSYVYKIPFIFIRQNKPLIFQEGRDYKKDLLIFNKLLFYLSFTNYMPFGNMINSIRIQDNILKANTKENFLIKIDYNNLYIFDDYKLEGLDVPYGKTSDINLVIDWFEIIRQIMFLENNLTSTDDEFVKHINFCRLEEDSPKFSKSFYAISKIKDEDLQKFEFSEAYCRFKIKKMVKDAGIRGVLEKDRNYYKPLKMLHLKREIFPLGRNIYKETENIKFIDKTPEEILNNIEINDSFIKSLEKHFGNIL